MHLFKPFLGVILLTLISAPASAVLAPASIPITFSKLLASPTLSNPSMIVIDGLTGEVIFERNAFSARKPASVMKIFSAAVTLEYLDPSMQFSTSIYLGVEPKTLVINGSFDPWISLNGSVARKMNRTSLPYLALNSLARAKSANQGSSKGYTVLYSDLNSKDLYNLKGLWAKQNFKPRFQRISSEAALVESGEFIVEGKSPALREILNFTLMHSDNLLADRVALLASKAAGNAFSMDGVSLTFSNLLAQYNIDSSKLVAADASGLSKENRITANMMGQFLYSVRKEEKFAPLYESLPVGGISGTLRDRFIDTAPTAIGLVRAKTGTLNGTASLAGYVQSSDREYIFVTIADRIPKGTRAGNKARAAIDRILGRIAAPFAPIGEPEIAP